MHACQSRSLIANGRRAHEAAAEHRIRRISAHLAPPHPAALRAPAAATTVGVQRLCAAAAKMVASGRMHGCTVAVGHGGTVIHAEGFGAPPPLSGDGLMAPGSPIKADTIFITASVTKPLAALAALQCIERGLLRLDQPISARILGFKHGAVTLRYMLTHTSGLADTVPEVDRTTHPSLAEHTAAACTSPLLFEPGSDISYSSMAFHLVAELVAAGSGRPLPTFLRDEVFQPLGLADLPPKSPCPCQLISISTHAPPKFLCWPSLTKHKTLQGGSDEPRDADRHEQ